MVHYTKAEIEYCNSKKHTIRILVDKWIPKEKKFIPDSSFVAEYEIKEIDKEVQILSIKESLKELED